MSCTRRSSTSRIKKWRWVYRTSRWRHIVEVEGPRVDGGPVWTADGPGVYHEGRGLVLENDEVMESEVKLHLSPSCPLAVDFGHGCVFEMDEGFCSKPFLFFCEELRADLREDYLERTGTAVHIS